MAGTCTPPVEFIKMCRTCFSRYEKCYYLKSEIFDKLHLAYDKVSTLFDLDEATVEPVSPDASLDTATIHETPRRKRTCCSGKPPAKRISTDTSFTLSSAAASPPVTVSIASNILIIQNDNVNFQITVTYKSGCKNYALLTPNRRHLSKSIARGHKRGLVDHCFCDPETQRYIMNKLNRQVRGEVKKMCSDAVGSILQNSSYEALMNFRLVVDLFYTQVYNMAIISGGRSCYLS